MLRSVRGFTGMVGAGHTLAAAEGLAVLKSGGNAVDAAIAAAGVLAVVAPHECGLGSDMFALVYEAKTGKVHGLNATGRSPAAATLERFRDGIPESGPLAVSVPGMVGGWQEAAARFGTRPLGSLLSAAIGYAENGFPVYDVMIENAKEKAAAIKANPDCSAMFMPGGRMLTEGERLRQPALAASLRAIARDGPDAFYRGPIGKSLAAYIQSVGGILSAEDMAAYEPLWQEVVSAGFMGHTVHSMPPNSWGSATLLQLMALEREGIAAVKGNEAEAIIRGIRARKLAYKLLAGCVADPAVAGDRAREVLARFARGETTAPGKGTESRGSDTSNVIVVDAQGNAVSLLQSVFVPFGSGVLAGDTGILLNNRMRGFSTTEGDPNCVAPSKRPAQTLTPMLVTQGVGKSGGGISAALNTPGGPGQTGTLAQFLVRTLAWGETAAQAIAAPRWAMTLKGRFILEESSPADVRAAVLAQEPEVDVTPWGSVNYGSLIAFFRDGEGWAGCADSRRNAAVYGY